MEEVVDAGWAQPDWPPDLYGRGVSKEAAAAVIDEFGRAGAPRGSIAAAGIAANTIRAFAASDTLRSDVLRKLLTGEYRTCLLYSEPGAGSDLGGLQTRAERDGAEWIVNGQKVWTSGARTATHGLLAARTNWDVPKHRGITYFLLPMDQPGVEIRPIKQMTGHQTFNEVFFTDARVPDSLRVSEVDDGWRVLNAALAVERMVMGGGLERAAARDGDVAASPAAEAGATSSAGPGATPSPEADGAPAPEVRARPVDLVALANQAGRGGDPVIRQAIARMHALRRISRWNAERAEGSADMSVAVVLKLSMSEILHGSARIHAQLLGTEAMLTGQQSPQGEIANQTGMWAFINSIGGGSDQIQRNLIGERVLGLPHDPSVDRDVPFRDVRKASGVRPLGGARP
jgi:alkylation response protein AidB-like acyl-CoA dehydrogenase